MIFHVFTLDKWRLILNSYEIMQNQNIRDVDLCFRVQKLQFWPKTQVPFRKPKYCGVQQNWTAAPHGFPASLERFGPKTAEISSLSSHLENSWTEKPWGGGAVQFCCTPQYCGLL